jgi:uncharacterized RDD family membrane protein YckC
MATVTPRAPVSSSPQPVRETDRPGILDEPLDTTVRLVTPERIVFQYPIAGPFRRGLGYLLDFGVTMALIFVGVFAINTLTLWSASGLGPLFVVMFVVNWGYGAFCEGVFNGRTVGKWAIGVRAVSAQGVPITGAQAVLRNLVGALDGPIAPVLWTVLGAPTMIPPFFFLIGFASMVLTRRFQRLGDLAAGTMVVIEDRQSRAGVVRVMEPGVDALLPWLPVRIAAGPEMARALSDFVKRRNRFPVGLREEMASALARPLRMRFGLPADATSDHVLCAVYHRVFLGE